MSQTSFYQHPFFDVFTGTKLTQWTTSQKEGDVQETFDSSLGKNVIKIGGVTSTSNYIQVPAQKNLPKHSLGLTGKYLYMVLNVTKEKSFVCHFEYILNEQRAVRLSFSNIYKEIKNGGQSIQIPLNLPQNKWTFIVINVFSYFEENKCFATGTTSKFYLKSFAMHSQLSVKGVYTSDILYSSVTLPKGIQLKVPKDKDWFNEYAWIQLPHTEAACNVDYQIKTEQTQESFLKKQEKSQEKPKTQQNLNTDLSIDEAARSTTKSNLKQKPPRPTSTGSRSDKRVTFPALSRKTPEQEKMKTPQDESILPSTADTVATKKRPQSSNPSTKVGAKQSQENKQQNLKQESIIPKQKSEKITKLEESKLSKRKKLLVKEETKAQHSVDTRTDLQKYQEQVEEQKQQQLQIQQEQIQAIQEEKRVMIDKTSLEIQEIKETHLFNLQSKNICQNAEVTLYQEASLYDPNKSQRRNSENFVLKPDPIMALDRVIGMHPRFNPGKVFFNQDPKLSSEILFCQANLMLGYHHTLQKQRLFQEKGTTTIENMLIVRGYALTFCKKPSSATAFRGNKSDQDIMMTIWELDENEKPIFQFRPPLSKLRNISISADYQSLCLSGKDFQGRELILAYSFQELVKLQKIELLGRQLCDFDLVSLKFNSYVNNCFIGCGRENIRFFKIKNNFMPSQLVSLNNTARGKVFSNSTVAFKVDEQKHIKKPTTVFVSTECGLLYFVNYFTRQIDKILQIHEDPVRCLIAAPIKAEQSQIPFFFTASSSGTLRIWNSDFSKLVSEVSINQQVADCDISIDQKEISVLSKDGTLSLLELEASSFKVLMRSHQDEIIDIALNTLSGCLVSIGKDSSVKIWLAETMEQIHEFNTSEHDPPSTVTSSQKNTYVSVGFKSGFFRIFDMKDRVMVHENMIYDSTVMSISFSQNGKFMAVFFKNAKIVIINTELEFIPVKNIDYEFPNANYFSVDFSQDGSLLANISSNANTITVWETKNFSLKHYCDFTGEIISKLAFSPNGKDLLVMTTSSKLKILRLTGEGAQSMELETVREQFGLTDQECVDFTISSNGKFILAAGKEGLIRIYDYFLRGQVTAAQQAFTGHLEFPNKIILSHDMRYLFSIGRGNGLYRWAFFGDKTMPDDLTQQFEQTQTEIKRLEEKENEINLPVFDSKSLGTYTEQQISQMREQIAGQKNINNFAATSAQQLPREHMDLLQDGGLSLVRRPKIEYTPAGYVFEQHDIALQKVLGCSLYPKVKNNLVWDKKNHYLAFSMQNILILESLDIQKTQTLKNECHDIIKEVKLSPDSRLLLIYTQFGIFDSFPQIIIWDTTSRRKVSQIAIEDNQIVSVEFSNASNMLLVLSFNGNTTQPRTTIAVWDFLDGRRDYLSKSVVAEQILEAKWNTYVKTRADEFVTISKQKYAYWRITESLHMDTQAGMLPKEPYFFSSAKDDSITCLSFVEPMLEQNSVYLLLGLSNGDVWVLDTRTNYFLHKFKVLNCAISKITSVVSRIIIEGKEDTMLHCWELKKTIGDFDYDASDPGYFFSGPEKKLQIDGFPSSSFYDSTATEAIIISSNSSFWLINFIEELTVKIKSCHDPSNQLNSLDFKYVTPNQFNPEQQAASGANNHYDFDQNYLVGSTGKDGVVKVWSMFDLEHQMNFIVPKEQCLCVAMHQFKPFMISSFTDGYIRFFDLQECKNLGRCLINSANEEPDPVSKKLDTNDYVVHMRILPSGNHILCATKNGQIILIYVETWLPLAITLQNFVSLNSAINSFDVSFLEPYNKWLAGSSNGKVVVYNRQDCNSFKQELFDKAVPPIFIFMDSFNIQEYVDNFFTETKKVNTLDHFYSLAKRNLVYNEKSPENETEAVFLNNDLASYICFVRKSNNLFIRNFELHQVVKRIQLGFLCKNMQIAPGSAPYVYIIGDNNSLNMIDFVNEKNFTKLQTVHESVRLLKVCPNGRYVLTAGDKGDIIIYSVRRARPDLEAPSLPADGTIAYKENTIIKTKY